MAYIFVSRDLRKTTPMNDSQLPCEHLVVEAIGRSDRIGNCLICGRMIVFESDGTTRVI